MIYLSHFRRQHYTSIVHTSGDTPINHRLQMVESPLSVHDQRSQGKLAESSQT